MSFQFTAFLSVAVSNFFLSVPSELLPNNPNTSPSCWRSNYATMFYFWAKKWIMLPTTSLAPPRHFTVTCFASLCNQLHRLSRRLHWEKNEESRCFRVSRWGCFFLRAWTHTPRCGYDPKASYFPTTAHTKQWHTTNFWASQLIKPKP